jgi:3-deoxy-D-manno-octulosonic-acid transferase
MFTIFLYRLLFLPIFLLAMPYYAFRMWRRGGYGKDFKFRFGAFKKLPKRKVGKRRLWIQAVSVGEIKAIGRLIDLLGESDEYEIALTTTTSTAYELAKKLYGKKTLFIGLFPFDFWPFSKLAWDKIFPHVAILMESEIWPEHIWQASLRNVPVILINARISDKTFPRYKFFSGVAAPILEKISHVISSDQISAERCRDIGIPPNRIKIAGNMKFDSEIKPLESGEAKALRRALGFGENDPILLGSSTWPGEEEMLLRALGKCRGINRQWKLLLVPRHSERRDKVATVLQGSKFKWHQRSKGHAAAEVDVCLADTTGELQMLTSIATVAFIGKSLAPNDGGQSPLDAACCGVPMVYGSKMTNFRDICSSLERSKCVIKVRDAATAISALVALARDEDKRKNFAKNLKEWHKNNCGASEFVCKKIREIAFAKK